jgi:hypothetical protein
MNLISNSQACVPAPPPCAGTERNACSSAWKPGAEKSTAFFAHVSCLLLPFIELASTSVLGVDLLAALVAHGSRWASWGVGLLGV